MPEKDEGYFVMKLTPIKQPKNKILKWLFWNAYWEVWNCWRSRMRAKFFWFLVWLTKPLVKNLEQYEKNKTK